MRFVIRSLIIAATFAAWRILIDAVAPYHPRWWFTAAIAFSTSMWTSMLWLPPRRTAALSLPSNEGDNHG